MIVPLVVLATFLARISAQFDGVDTECVLPLQPYQACTAALQKDCPAGKTLFDMLDPEELCKTPAPVGGGTCGDALASVTKELDDDGCCTLNSLYPIMETLGGDSNCSTSQPLSYEGFSQTVSYFCENQPYDDADFYCLKDGQAYLKQLQPALAQVQYLVAQGDFFGAMLAFNNAVDCNKIAATKCCYPSLVEFIGGCGDEDAQALVPLIQNFMSSIPDACATFQSVPISFNGGICAGLTEIDNCFASSDSNCSEDDDDAAFSVVPTFASMFAAIAGFLFFARQF